MKKKRSIILISILIIVSAVIYFYKPQHNKNNSYQLGIIISIGNKDKSNILYYNDQLQKTGQKKLKIGNIASQFGFLKDKNGIVAVSNRIFETQLYDMFLSETAVNNQMYMKVSFDRNQFIVSGMLQMPLVMQKFYEYYEEIYSEKDQKFNRRNRKWKDYV